MKILQVLPALTAGGAEGFVTNLGVSLVDIGAEVRFFLLAGVRGERGQVLLRRLQAAGIDVVGVGERNPASFGNLIRLGNTIRTWRPNIVQANLYPAEVACVSARLLALGAGARFTRRLANTDQCSFRSRRVVKALDRFFHMTISCSPSVADSYRNLMGKRLRSTMVTITNGGVLAASNTTVEQRCQARFALGVPNEAFVVAHIGRIHGSGGGTEGGLCAGQKAQDVLLEAFAKAFEASPQCVLLLVGDGPLRPEAESLAQRLGIEGQVRFLGQQPEPWPALRAADFFCFPSRHEGLPNVLPEAASCGLPVVASDIPEIRYLYPGEAWVLAPVNDVSKFAMAMRTVKAHPEHFARHAREVAQSFRDRFSMRACAEKYLGAYEAALTKPGIGIPNA